MLAACMIAACGQACAQSPFAAELRLRHGRPTAVRPFALRSRPVVYLDEHGRVSPRLFALAHADAIYISNPASGGYVTYADLMSKGAARPLEELLKDPAITVLVEAPVARLFDAQPVATTSNTCGVAIPTTLVLNPPSLAFTVAAGASTVTQTVAISSSSTLVLNWSATTATNWIGLSPSQGTTPSSVTVSVTPGTLTPGNYSGSVTFQAAGASNSPLTLAVTLRVVQPPSVSGIAPSHLAAGSSDFSLAVTGQNFDALSSVQWNSSKRPTTFVSATQLTAAISAADIAAAGAAEVSVISSLGIVSNLFPFTIDTPVAGTFDLAAADAMPGATADVAVRAALGTTYPLDSISVTLSVTAAGAGPPISGPLTFTAAAGLPAPVSVSAPRGNGTITASWSAVSPGLTGNVNLGTVGIPLPTNSSVRQTYSVGVLASTATSSGKAAAIAAGNPVTVLVSGTYPVGDVFPTGADLNGNGNSDDSGEFGDGVVNNLDLIAALRAVTNVPGHVPGACSDRYDAMDSAPADTASQRGGNGALDTLDLMRTLRRVTGVDTSRPSRTPRGHTCPAGATPAASVVTPSASGTVRIGQPIEEARKLRLPLYVSSETGLDLMGLSLAAGIGHDGALRFTPGDAAAPDILDEELPGTVAMSWLNGISLQAGTPLLLGWIEADSTSNLSNLQVYGISANRRDGSPVRLAGEIAQQQ